MQAARACENHRAARLDRNCPLPLLVVVSQFAAQASQNIGHACLVMSPFVHARIFQIQHHAGSTRVQHLDAKLGIVSRPRHLVSLVLAPGRQCDLPAIAHGVGREAMRGLLPSTADCNTSARRTASSCCRGVKIWCSGRKKFQNPPGRSVFGSKRGGALLLGFSELPVSGNAAVMGIVTFSNENGVIVCVHDNEHVFTILAKRMVSSSSGQCECSI